MTNRLLTWRPRFDEKSRKYGIAHTLPVMQLARRSMQWSCPVYFDQSEEPSCTGFAMTHAVMSDPFPNKNLTPPHARYLYQRAKELDQWPGEDYEGSSVLGAAAAAKELNWVKSYHWCFTEYEISTAIGYYGPVAFGSQWTQGMMEPDDQGVIRALGKPLGGHAYLLTGYDAARDLYRIHNSWGISWGKMGDAFIPSRDIDALMREGAEACALTKAAE